MIIYKSENKLNGQVYIGKTILTLEKRKQEHLYSVGRNKKTYFHNALRTYGFDNFEWSIITETDCESKLNALEKFYIITYKKIGKVYNLTDGGEGSSGRIYSEESKKKMSESQKGKKRKPFSEEHKKKISEATKNMSEEQRQKIIESNKKRIHSEESRIKRSEKMKGRVHTEETRKKISESNKGKKFSLETREKISEANRKRVWTEESRKKISESRKVKLHGIKI